MMQWHKPSRQLLFVLAVFLLSYACICPTKLHIPSFHTDSTAEVLSAANSLPSDEQSLSTRLDNSSYEAAPSGRIRLLHKGAMRTFQRITVCHIFWLLTLLWIVMLQKCCMQIREFIPRSLQLVQFLHRSDGKASALFSHTEYLL